MAASITKIPFPTCSFYVPNWQMEPDSSPLAPAPHALPPGAPSPSLATSGGTSVPTLTDDDALSVDPADYDWIPVTRKRRADGWSHWCQRRFIEELAERGSVEQAARAVGKSVQSAYRLRRTAGAEGFDAAWSAAIDQASKKLLDDAFERALVGTDEPVFDRDGRRVGRRLRQSDKLLMFLLRAYLPERFRYAGRETRAPGEPAPPPLACVAEAIALIGPPVPGAPHLDLDARTLAERLATTRDADGRMPERFDVDARPDPAPEQMPMGDDFERMLDDAKREGRGRPPFDDAEWAAHKKMLMG